MRVSPKAALLGAALLATNAGAQTYDPMNPGAAPPASTAPAALAQPKTGAAYDPYGTWENTTISDTNPTGGATKLLSVIDGTPFYEKADHGGSDSTDQRMLPVWRGGDLPVDAGPKSPFLPGTKHPFRYHYLIDFWKKWPDAKVRAEPGSPDVLPGYVPPDLSYMRIDNGGVPAEAVPVLRRQAEAVYAALIRIPMMQRAQGFSLNGAYLRVFPVRTESGGVVYAWRLRIPFNTFGGKRTQRPDGRWVANGGGPAALEIRTNARTPERPPPGVYHGTQVVYVQQMNVTLVTELGAMVTSSDRPLTASEYRNGGGDTIANPDFLDLGRPKTDIQFMAVIPGPDNPSVRSGPHQGSESPDGVYGRIVASIFLVDWKAVVDQVNSPGAPRAK